MSDLFEQLGKFNLPPGVLETLRTLQPPPLPHRGLLLLRLALPRTFTKKLYDLAAAELAPVPMFEGPGDPSGESSPKVFTDLPEVEPVMGFPGRYAVRDEARARLLQQWIANSDRQKWAQTFLQAMDPKHEVESLDRLQLLFWANQAEARNVLEGEFNASDIRNEIPRCRTLVQLVSPVIQLVGDAESRSLLSELRARSDTRNVFFSEFLQTEDYFPRTAIEDPLTAFLTGPTSQQWIFHVHATGGMGKTTTLRRLLSHNWITGTNRYPCAWLDFDYLDVEAILQAPALLCLPMAAQWNEQLATPTFGSFLEPSFQPLASLLFRPRSGGGASGFSDPLIEQISRSQYRAGRSNPMRCGMLAGALPPPSLEERNNRLASAQYLRSLWDDKFPGTIGTMPPDRPVLLIIDTLEEASSQHGKELLAILQLIGSLRDKVRAVSSVDLRLILSGRYQLGRPDHVPEFAAPSTQGGFSGQFQVIEMTGFDPPEATNFLKSRIKPAQHNLINAMVEKSQGLPFNLSLFAEWAAADPNLKDDTIRTAEEITTVILIERIIKRIPYQPLRWIVRYGVVPRSLNPAFLSGVMRVPLEEALSGKARSEGKDLPNQDQWSEETGFQFDAAALWRDYVMVYAAEKGWMIPADSQGQTVGFRADIRTPMRRLLRDQRIFADLHRRASEWFLRSLPSAPAPELWAQAQVEHVYHSLQLRSYESAHPAETAPPPPAILDLVRGIFDNSRLRGNASLRRAVAEQLSSEDFAELATPEKAWIAWRLAEATAAANDYVYLNPVPVSHLMRAFQLAGEQSAALLPAFAHEWKRAADGSPVSVFLGRLNQIPPDDASQLALLIAESAGDRSSLTGDALEAARRMWSDLKRPTVPREVIDERLARFYGTPEGGPNLERALELFEEAAQDYLGRGNRAKYLEMSRQAARSALNFGRIFHAERILLECQPPDERVPALELQFARIELAKGQPGLALDRLRDLSKLKVTDSQSMDALLIGAEALSQRCLWNEASQAWQDATNRALRVTNRKAIVRATIGRLRLEYWWMRRSREANIAIDPQIRRFADPSDADELDVWQFFLQPDAELARRRAGGDLGCNSPNGRVRMILMLSQVVPAFPPSLWKVLVDQAGQIPRSGRILTLMEPVLMGEPPAIPLEFRTAIAEALRGSPEGPEETAWHAVRYGELLAWLGLYDEAAELLRSSVVRPPVSWQAATYRERRRIEQRMRDWGSADAPPEPDPADYWWKIWAHTPFRRAAATLENALAGADAGRTDIVERALRMAQQELDQAPFLTWFHRIATILHDPSARPAVKSSESTTSGTAKILPPGPLAPRPDALEPDMRGTAYQIVAMRAQAGRLAVRVSGGPDEDQLISSDGEGLEIMLRSSGIPRRLLRLKWDDLVAELRDVLRQTKADMSGSRKLWLRTPLSPLSAAPWEAGVPPGGIGLIRSPSGWLEDRGVEARDVLLARLQATPPSEPPLIVSSLTMIMPMSSQDRESPQAEFYAEFGRASAAIPFVPKFGPGDTIGLIYVAACLAETSALTEPIVAGTDLTASALANLLLITAVKPTVVLDVPAVRGDADFMHQLLLRNFFAQVLLDSGSVHCVVATGLCSDDVMRHTHDLLVSERPRARWSQAELYEAILNVSHRDDHPNTCALFSAMPDAPWLPLGAAQPAS